MIGIEQERMRTILRLALPIIAGMVSQTMLNLVDTAMVGTLGNAAIAAVGVGSFANFLAQAFILGISAGVQAMASRRHGEGSFDRTALPLNGGLVLVVALALPWTVVLYELTPTLFPYLNDDPAVFQLGIPYFRVRLIGMVAVGMNFAFRGYWNGIGKSKLYMRTLLIMHLTNVVLSYVLIFGKLGLPALGVTGAAIGTTSSIFVGTCTYYVLGLRHARGYGFLRGLPSRADLRNIIRISTPSGLQQLFFAGGFTVLFWIIGRVGTAEVAAANVLINVMLFAILPGLGLGLASASLVGQALGRGSADDAQQWAWDVARVGVLFLGVLGLPMVLFPEPILSLFLHDPETRQLAELPLMLVGMGIAIDGVGLVLLNSLMGAGATTIALVVSTVLQWGVFLPAAWLAGPVMGWGLLGIWVAQIGHRILQAGVLAIVWRRGHWAAVDV